MKKVVINGRVFKRKNITGLQRFTIEILKQLDKIVKKGEIEMLVPKEHYNLPRLENIKIIELLNMHEVVWEQIVLPFYALFKKRKILNMANSSPILKPDIIVIHDIVTVKDRKKFRIVKRTYDRVLYALTIKRATKLITVSEFSKQEIAEYYHINKNKIDIISNRMATCK